MTLNPIFNELDHRMSVIKRWGILHTIQRQSLAEHCFNVARIATAIWVPWLEGRSDLIDKVYEWALHHDDEEVLTLDLPSMVKPYFDDGKFREDHKDLLRVHRPYNTDVKNCVKLADKMEGYYFLAMENALGNRYSEEHFKLEKPIILKLVRDTFDEKVLGKVENWLTVSANPRSTRFNRNNDRGPIL